MSDVQDDLKQINDVIDAARDDDNYAPDNLGTFDEADDDTRETTTYSSLEEFLASLGGGVPAPDDIWAEFVDAVAGFTEAVAERYRDGESMIYEDIEEGYNVALESGHEANEVDVFTAAAYKAIVDLANAIRQHDLSQA